MLKINDLRLGNWLERDGLYLKVTEIWNDSVWFHNETEFHPNDVNGIPLTEEILIKAGFKKNSNWQDTWLFHNDFGVNFHQGKWYWNDLMKSVELKYVHQLQNLYYALTNEELIINF